MSLTSSIGNLKAIAAKLGNVASNLNNGQPMGAPTKAQIQAAYQRVANRMVPHIRVELGRSYMAAGIGKNTTGKKKYYKPTGTLFKTCVQEAQVGVDERGIFWKYPAGKQYPDGSNVYKVAATLRYGGIRAGGSLSQGGKKSVKSGLAIGGASSIKLGPGAAVATYMKPKKPFGILDSAQRARLNGIRAGLLRQEFEKLGIKIGAEI